METQEAIIKEFGKDSKQFMKEVHNMSGDHIDQVKGDMLKALVH